MNLISLAMILLSSRMSVCQSVCLFVCLSVSLCLCLSVCLSSHIPGNQQNSHKKYLKINCLSGSHNRLIILPLKEMNVNKGFNFESNLKLPSNLLILATVFYFTRVKRFLPSTMFGYSPRGKSTRA